MSHPQRLERKLCVTLKRREVWKGGDVSLVVLIYFLKEFSRLKICHHCLSLIAEAQKSVYLFSIVLEDKN